MGAARWVCFSLAIALAFGSSGALSEVYRWKDSNGKVHFGDRPDSTDPQVVKEVIVPSPNLATGLKGMPSTTAGGKPKAVAGEETTVPAAPVGAAEGSRPKSAPKRGIAEQSKDSCQAKVAAFRASRACFDACGSTNGRFGTRNNAGCEHCVEQPMPSC
ncbi:DUF4124 domain-containing protein [Hydrogenophaga sp.]|uniref:DUF4124 domain-containing protein n=1 Tax=Hydrogenophaga sp. TaxID=1904254 RepID=UPI0025BD3D58|nr:DUF4124 domain-containing protein [Hydrogenophaga sp.]MBT9463821.1 DUF4124 domain-containing protein [Hydrogenophaga sp.]